MSRHSEMGTGDWLMSAVTRNPEGLLLLAAGAALLLRSGTSRNGRNMTRAMSQRGGQAQRGQGAQHGGQSMQDSDGQWDMPEGVSRTAQSAREYAQSARDYASDVTSRAADTASSYASALSETGRTVYEQSERYARQAQSTLTDTVSRVVQEQPLAIALAGLAAGAAVAAAFPATDIERRTLGPAGEKLTDYASQTGEQLRTGAKRAGERLMDVVEERGLSTDNLKDTARDVAGTFGGAFSGDETKRGGSSGAAGSSGAGPSTTRTGGAGSTGKGKSGGSDISGAGA